MWGVAWPLAQPERRDAVMQKEEKVLEALEAKRRRDANEAPAAAAESKAVCASHVIQH